MIQEPSAGTVWATPTARSSWRKPHYISVDEAVARLQPHIGVPSVLPRDPAAGLPNLRGWLADPKYLEWGSVDGTRTERRHLARDAREVRRDDTA